MFSYLPRLPLRPLRPYHPPLHFRHIEKEIYPGKRNRYINKLENLVIFPSVKIWNVTRSKEKSVKEPQCMVRKVIRLGSHSTLTYAWDKGLNFDNPPALSPFILAQVISERMKFWSWTPREEKKASETPNFLSRLLKHCSFLMDEDENELAEQRFVDFVSCIIMACEKKYKFRQRARVGNISLLTLREI